MAEVGRAVLVRRRPDGDEHDLGAADRLGDVGGEREPLLLLVPLDEILEPRLVDRQDVLLQLVDLAGVDIGADDVVARLGEAGADDEPDVTRSHDSDSHAIRGR